MLCLHVTKKVCLTNGRLKKALEMLLHNTLDGFNITADEKTKVRKLLASPQVYRDHAGYKTGLLKEERKATRSHLSGMSEVGEAFYEFVESMCFEDTFSSEIMNHVINRGSVKDLFKIEPIANALEVVKSKDKPEEQQDENKSDDNEKYSPDADEDEMMTPAKLGENWLASHRRLGRKLHQRKCKKIKELFLVMHWMAVSCGQREWTRDVHRF